MLRSLVEAARGAIRAGTDKDTADMATADMATADMATYAAKKLLLTQQAQSDLRSELLYPDLHGTSPDIGRSQLQPAEKKLIGFSFGIGLFLLAALVIVNHVF
jgi:hypothetical protein